MALTATATQGFEYVRTIQPDEIIWLPGDPGVTFTRGDTVVWSNGVLAAAAADGAPVYVVDKTTVCPSATSEGFPSPDLHPDGSWGSTAAITNTLVPCRLIRPCAGTPVFKCTFENHHDDTVAAYTASTRAVTLTTSTGANDDINSALMYVYEGTGAGQWNIIEDYVHGTLVATVHRSFETALSTDSKVIILEGEGSAGDGISLGGRLTVTDTNTLTVDNGQDNGEWIIHMDAREIPTYLKNLTLPVVRALAVV